MIANVAVRIRVCVMMRISGVVIMNAGLRVDVDVIVRVSECVRLCAWK